MQPLTEQNPASATSVAPMAAALLLWWLGTQPASCLDFAGDPSPLLFPRVRGGQHRDDGHHELEPAAEMPILDGTSLGAFGPWGEGGINKLQQKPGMSKTPAQDEPGGDEAETAALVQTSHTRRLRERDESPRRRHAHRGKPSKSPPRKKEKGKNQPPWRLKENKETWRKERRQEEASCSEGDQEEEARRLKARKKWEIPGSREDKPEPWTGSRKAQPMYLCRAQPGDSRSSQFVGETRPAAKAAPGPTMSVVPGGPDPAQQQVVY